MQFIHPGGEHWPDHGRTKRWNRNAHRRKFLKHPGTHLDDGTPRTGDLVFWGEWEPESSVIAHIQEPVPDGPHHIYEPYYVPRTSYLGLQNTDPFVFGEQFLYTGCLQHARGRPTQLRHLETGSVVLFGSCLHRDRFVVDTVFVVRDAIDHDQRDYLDELGGRVSDTYETVTLSPWYENPIDPTRRHRLYFGATLDARVDDMFSFFPCLPYEPHSRGFARPVIRIPGVITSNLLQGKRLNVQTSLHDVKTLWDEVVDQVTAQGLALGISTALPPQLDADDARAAVGR